MNIRRATLNDAAAIAEVHVAAWRESYVGVIPQSVLDSLSVTDRTEKWQHILARSPIQPNYVAECENVIGFASGGVCRDSRIGEDMEVYAVYLLDAVKRQGIGTKLIRVLAEEFLREGARSAGVWVVKKNLPARRFYEKLRAKPVAEKIETSPGYDLTEVGYVWPDLRVLAG